mmetsp:Transcript_29463/g.85894  ORF Transcript_29463/g.85894 Transcript_29463/m.85894 type:complete len:290 (-) Transcript_29463:1452-2321(-)
MAPMRLHASLAVSAGPLRTWPLLRRLLRAYRWTRSDSPTARPQSREWRLCSKSVVLPCPMLFSARLRARRWALHRASLPLPVLLLPLPPPLVRGRPLEPWVVDGSALASTASLPRVWFWIHGHLKLVWPRSVLSGSGQALFASPRPAETWATQRRRRLPPPRRMKTWHPCPCLRWPRRRAVWPQRALRPLRRIGGPAARNSFWTSADATSSSFKPNNSRLRKETVLRRHPREPVRSTTCCGCASKRPRISEPQRAISTPRTIRPVPRGGTARASGAVPVAGAEAKTAGL